MHLLREHFLHFCAQIFNANKTYILPRKMKFFFFRTFFKRQRFCLDYFSNRTTSHLPILSLSWINTVLSLQDVNFQNLWRKAQVDPGRGSPNIFFCFLVKYNSSPTPPPPRSTPLGSNLSPGPGQNLHPTPDPRQQNNFVISGMF